MAASADVRTPSVLPLNYVGELDVAVGPDSDVDFNWTVRGQPVAGYARVLVQLRTSQRLADGTSEPMLDVLFVQEATTAGAPNINESLIQGGVRIPPAKAGNRFRIGATVRGEQITVSVDGRDIATVRDARVSVAPGYPNLDIYGAGGIGSIRVYGARFFDVQ